MENATRASANRNQDKDRYVEQNTQDETLLAEGYLNFEWPCIYKEMKTTEFPS
jgi:hypothetical protein